MSKTKKPTPKIQDVAFAFFDKRGVDVALPAIIAEIKKKTGRKLALNGIARLRSLHRSSHGRKAEYGSRMDNLRSRIELLEKAVRKLGGDVPRYVASRAKVKKTRKPTKRAPKPKPVISATLTGDDARWPTQPKAAA